MKTGTKSILFGAHQFVLHPLLVALGWWRLYGFPLDPRLWVLFVVHDIGYWGVERMDDQKGEDHVWVGARIMGTFDDTFVNKLRWLAKTCNFLFGNIYTKNWSKDHRTSWYCMSFYHSRFMAKRYGVEPSELCYADKLAIVYHPTWLYILQTTLTGELKEYMSDEHHKDGGKYEHMHIDNSSKLSFVLDMKENIRSWLELY